MQNKGYRLCLGCKTLHAREQLLRIVRLFMGDIVVDLSGKLPGRGAYICYNKECLIQARKQKRLQKALKVNPPETIWKDLEILISDKK